MQKRRPPAVSFCGYGICKILSVINNILEVPVPCAGNVHIAKGSVFVKGCKALSIVIYIIRLVRYDYIAGPEQQIHALTLVGGCGGIVQQVIDFLIGIRSAVIAAGADIGNVEQGIKVGGRIGIVRTPSGNQAVVIADAVCVKNVSRKSGEATFSTEQALYRHSHQSTG